MIVKTPSVKRPFVTIKPETRDEQMSDISDAEIIALHKQYGAILFRGFNGSTEAFKNLGDRFISSSVAKHDPSRKSVTDDHKVQTVNEGGDEFYMHPEIGREPWQPDIALFNCQIAPWRLGQTSFVDGVTIAKALSESSKELLLNNDLEFINLIEPEKLKKWLGLDNPNNDDLIAVGSKYCCHFRKDGNNYQRIFRRPSLHKPMFIDELAFGNYLLFSRFHHKREDYPMFTEGQIIPQEVCDEIQHLSQELSYKHRWKKHDTLVLDNTRFMHGRNRIATARGRKILARFGFVNFFEPTPKQLAQQPWRSANVWLESEWQ
jgi:alpha-ketoglutarate-dependent taurine dioxygenase